MDFRSYKQGEEHEIESLFNAVFEDSEGEAEGALIGDLVNKLLATTKQEDLYGFLATKADELAGAIFFTRMHSKNETDIFLLAPVAVRTKHQGEGIGKALIKYGINELKERGVRIFVTYGDPKFYTKVGFQQIEERRIRPPFKLSQPEGWMAQFFDANESHTIDGKCSCVEALNNPKYW